MMRIRKILFATDFSRSSKRAFDAALEMAKQNRAELTIFHALAMPIVYTDGEAAPPSLYNRIEADARKYAESALARLEAAAKKAKVKCLTQLRKGAAAQQILRAAKGRRVDLIVMGTQGRTGLSKLLLGSVASRVVSMSDRPVLTVRGR
ncbi:MAG TPA: universal stress protein [Candidatus Binatia bacterium]